MPEWILHVVLTLFFFISFHLLSSHEVEDEINRSQFPQGFLFGASTSSYQIEGAPLEDGKGLSNWDVFSHISGKIKNDENGDIADDHYHRYLEDIKLMSSLGINVYRFSISWARILPRGIYGDINPSGIIFYNNIIDNLLLSGIEPFVTIQHHDLPQELEERYGGWLSPLIQRDFVHFAEICFKSFGDRVKYWATINEPSLVADMGFMRGTYSPGHCSPPYGNCFTGNSDVEPLLVMHNMLLSHAKAVDLYRKHYQAKQGGTIGIVGHTFMYEPLRDEECDKQAANRAFAFVIGWLLDPLVFGDYPAEMHSILGNQLPKFSPEEKSLLRGSLDFFGINHYGALYVKDCSFSNCSLEASRPIKGFVETTGMRDGIPIGDQTGMPRFFVVPRAMESIVDYIKIRYHNMPMYITENGYSSPPNPDATTHDLLHDFKRVEYHKAYLAALLRAISLFLLHRRQRERKREATRFGNKKIRQGRPDEACKYLEEMMEKGMKAPQLDYNKFGADFSKNGNPGILEELARKMNFAGKFDVSNVLASWADMMKKNVERRGATRSFGPRM